MTQVLKASDNRQDKSILPDTLGWIMPQATRQVKTGFLEKEEVISKTTGNLI
ncbi:hypothetical protein [Dyadobacter sediminis]|uniref:hypothetical protein n=1 Tax=Dyadobacter sediminis TaxID=1493691 RepID=UPI001486A05E|nr:hypothetical protein [Dyadobacter sediminis]